METKKPNEITADMEEVRQQFDVWRSAHARRSRIPETLWTSAVKLAQRHGLYRTAKALHLDYTRLKAFVNGDSGRKPKDAPAFVELLTADRGPECVVEMENARGKTMRIHLRGFAAPDLVVLSRIFWSSRG